MYDSISRRFDETLAEVSRRLREVLACEARSLQQSVRNGVRRTATETCRSFANSPVAIHKRLGAVVGRVVGTGMWVKLEALSSHTTSTGAQTGASRDHPSSDYGYRKDTRPSTTPNSPRAHNHRDRSEYSA